MGDVERHAEPLRVAASRTKAMSPLSRRSAASSGTGAEPFDSDLMLETLAHVARKIKHLDLRQGAQESHDRGCVAVFLIGDFMGQMGSADPFECCKQNHHIRFIQVSAGLHNSSSASVGQWLRAATAPLELVADPQARARHLLVNDK